MVVVGEGETEETKKVEDDHVMDWEDKEGGGEGEEESPQEQNQVIF